VTKFTLTINTDDPSVLRQITYAITSMGDPERTTERAGPATGPVGVVEPPPGDPAAAKKAAAATKRRAAATVKKATEAAQRVADAQKVIDAEGTTAADVGLDDTVSVDDLKGAVRAYIEANSIEAVKAIFFEFDQATKISDIPADRYAEVMARLV
jgi:hypothetical protein